MNDRQFTSTFLSSVINYPRYIQLETQIKDVGFNFNPCGAAGHGMALPRAGAAVAARRLEGTLI